MKLPQHIEGIERDGRTDSMSSAGVSAGVEASWLGWGKKVACWAAKKAVRKACG